jgi:hypothetical protein
LTYAAAIEKEGQQGEYLVVLAPRRFVDGTWVGDISAQSIAFEHGHVIGLTQDGTPLIKWTSGLFLPGMFKYDDAAGLLTVCLGSDDANAFTWVATYEIYVGTSDAAWYRDPTDAASGDAYYEPLIASAPQIAASVDEQIIGFLPAGSTSIALINAGGYFNRHVFDSSFNDCDVSIFHWVGKDFAELDAADFRLVYRGLGSTVDWTDQQVTLQVLDRTNVFAREYRHAGGFNYYTDLVSASLLDPNFRNRPVRTVFGVVDGVQAVNFSYAEDLAALSNCFYFAEGGGPGLTANSWTGTVTTGSTLTKTYLASTAGLRVDDDLFVSSHGAGDDFYITILTIGSDGGGPYITHADISPKVAAAAGYTPQRAAVGNVRVVQDGKLYRISHKYYSVTAPSSGRYIKLFVDNSNLVTDAVLPRFLGPADTVLCRIYGRANTETLGGSPFGSDSAASGNMSQGVVVLWKLLKEAVGLSENELDLDAFTALQSAVTDDVGFSLPFKTGDDFPLMRDVVAKFCQTLLLRIYLNSDLKWSVSRLAPLAASPTEVTDEEIVVGSIGATFDCTDLYSDIYVNYAPSEVDTRKETTGELVFSTVRSSSDVATWLHKTTRQKTFESMHFVEAQAQALADRLCFYYGDRRGTWRIKAKSRFLPTKVGDVLAVTRTRLPGFAFDESADRVRDLSTIATMRALNEIDITLDDQKGVEDNAGSW